MTIPAHLEALHLRLNKLHSIIYEAKLALDTIKVTSNYCTELQNTNYSNGVGLIQKLAIKALIIEVYSLLDSNKDKTVISLPEIITKLEHSSEIQMRPILNVDSDWWHKLNINLTGEETKASLLGELHSWSCKTKNSVTYKQILIARNKWLGHKDWHLLIAPLIIGEIDEINKLLMQAEACYIILTKLFGDPLPRGRIYLGSNKIMSSLKIILNELL